MASYQYLRDIKPEDLRPEPERVLTPAERRANWWHYHWKLVVLIAAAAAVALYYLIQFVTTPKTDFSVFVAVRFAVTDEEQTSLQEALQAAGPDLNGDGRTVVQLTVIQYDFTGSSDESDAYLHAAETVKLQADLADFISGIFILDDPSGFESKTGALAYTDGSTPEEGASDWQNMVADLSGSSLSGLTFSEAGGSTLYLGRRILSSDKAQEALPHEAEVWKALAG